MDLVINEKDDVYKIKVGAEVYKVSYPSWREAQEIEKDLNKVKDKGDEDKVGKFIEETLVKLGLDAKFFDLPGVKATHIFKIWSEINAIKK